MVEKSHEKNEDLQPQPPQRPAGEEFDAASKSLSEALRISFIVLKLIMIIVVVFFFVRGCETVNSDERAIVLRFGKIRGAAETRILKPRPWPYWIFPDPIEEIIKIPVEKRITVQINSFWHRPASPQGPGQRPFVDSKLNPLLDGYCITRGEQQSETGAGSAGSDYSIVHSRWQLTYQIGDPEDFFKNVYVEAVKPGRTHFDVVTESVTPLLKALFEDAVVTAMVNFTVDEAISSRAKIRTDVQNLLQRKLDDMQSGIKAVSVQLTTTWPRQVDAAFQAYHDASSDSAKLVSKAKGYAETILSEAAGHRAREIHAALTDKTMSREEKEVLWAQLAGQAQEKIAQARAHKTKVVETARANAEYLKRILPEYRKRPELFVKEVYQDAIEDILNSADEKMFVQPTEGDKEAQFWIIVNKDPKAKPKAQKE